MLCTQYLVLQLQLQLQLPSCMSATALWILVLKDNLDSGHLSDEDSAYTDIYRDTCLQKVDSWHPKMSIIQTEAPLYY